MQENCIYKAGLYLRLSKDDEQEGESVSIGTQRSILTDYCNKEGYTIHKVYIDDGYSGMNFERPGFKELLEDVERGLVNMVITKDLSRLLSFMFCIPNVSTVTQRFHCADGRCHRYCDFTSIGATHALWGQRDCN